MTTEELIELNIRLVSALSDARETIKYLPSWTDAREISIRKVKELDEVLGKLLWVHAYCSKDAVSKRLLNALDESGLTTPERIRVWAVMEEGEKIFDLVGMGPTTFKQLIVMLRRHAHPVVMARWIIRMKAATEGKQGFEKFHQHLCGAHFV